MRLPPPIALVLAGLLPATAGASTVATVDRPTQLSAYGSGLLFSRPRARG